MSDTRTRYHAIHTALQQIYGHPTGHTARHIQTLAALICGMIGSHHSQLPKIADQAPTGTAKTSSLIKRFQNWLQNAACTATTFFLPCVEPFLVALAAARPLELSIDGRAVGRHCVALVVSVVYRGRALPVAWVVVSGKKGHLPESTHLELLRLVHDIIPTWAEVIVLGDGEFDGCALQAAVEQAGWSYVCRTAKNTVVWRDDQKSSCAEMPVERDRPVVWEGVAMTGKQYGPIQIIA